MTDAAGILRPDLAAFSTRPGMRRLTGIGALSAVAGFAFLELLALSLAGTFEYPLDDVYIHLAMAEGIAHGHYGVNPGEYASASSSVLYPLLLAPFPGTALQRVLPLVWNLLAVTLCGALWGRIVACAALPSRRLATLLAILGPLGLNMGGVGFTGMENSLHAALSLVTLIGLWRFLEGGQTPAWFIAAIILAPLVRLEGLALSLGAAGVIGLSGRWRAGLALGLATLVPVASFALMLTRLGLDPLPGSVVAKMALAAPGASAVERTLVNLISNLSKPQGLYVAGLSLATLVMAFLRRGRARTVLALASACGMAQLLEGQIGWMHRYEHWIVVTTAGALLLASDGSRRDRLGRGIVLLAIAVGFPMFQSKNLSEYVWNPAAIHLQQAQMARFVHDDLREPVAVNDLGWMAWANDRYVLDLWGLGSHEVLHKRMEAPTGAWAAPILAAHGVHVAIIYAKWFGSALGPAWQPVAELRMDRKIGRLGDWVVTFYADDAATRARLTTELAAFAPTLPRGATLVMLP